jgi:hypothetical protein
MRPDAKKQTGVFAAMADRTRKPDAAGYQPLDPALVAAVMRQLGKR